MRTIWNGSISFGLVNIPVGLALATQRQDVSFRTLHRECGTPIKQKRWCPVHERDVEPEELVKGWEFAKGQYVLVEESDLEAVALTRSPSEKLAGHGIVAPEPVAGTPVIDLMEPLRQSVVDAQGRRAAKDSENGKAGSKAGSRSRKTPARKSA